MKQNDAALDGLAGMMAMADAAQSGAVLDLALGDPDLDTDARVVRAAMQDALHGYTHYGPAAGDAQLVAAICQSWQEDYGLALAPEQVMVTASGCHAMWLLLSALLAPGEEVVLFAPYFSPYPQQVRLAGGVPVEVATLPQQGFVPQAAALAAACGPNTRAVILNTPNNPTGVVYSADTLTRMAAILTEKSAQYGHNIFLVSDEPYRDIVFDGKTVPYPAAFYPHTLTCFSYSKSLSLPGERLGYVAVRPGCEGEDILVDMMSQISRFTGHNCPPSIIQRAVSRCQKVTSDLSVYQTNMELLYEKLTALGFEVERPGGTFYIFPKALEEDANAFCRKAREFDLLLVPSDSFGVKGYVRLAYCIDTEKVKRSLPAFEKLAAAYRK